MEMMAGCSRSSDITKYFSVISHQAAGKKSCEHAPGDDKPNVRCHILQSHGMHSSVSRSASRLHRLKFKKCPKASTQLIEEPLNDLIVMSESGDSCAANTQTRRSTVMGCRGLTQITAQSHGAKVQPKLSQNKISAYPHRLTSQAKVQSAVHGRTKPALTVDKRVASISITKQESNESLSPRNSHKHHVKLALPGKSYSFCSELDLKLLVDESSSAVRHGSKASGWRDELSGSVRKSLLDEIKASSLPYPVSHVFTMLLKKYKENLQESENPDKEVSTTTLLSPVREKRKRQNEKGDPETARKRQRSNLGLEEAPLTGYGPSLEQQVTQCQTSEALPRRSRLSRTQRLRQQQRECLGGCPELTTDPSKQRESHQSHNFQPQICRKAVHNIEDLLWTDKYRPQHSSEVVGNSASVKKLHSWLKKWKLRADFDERRKVWESRQEINSNHTWDCGDFQGEAGGDEVADLCNTMLITGPSGLGKTASVYACAQELGFQVFEVNASSQRSGRHVLTQLKEATQSHQVIQPSSGLKPAYLSNSSNTSANCHPVPSKAPSTSRGVVSVCRKEPPQASRCRRGGSSAAATTLANFFNVKRKLKIINLDGLSLSTKQDEQLPNSVGTIRAGTAVGPGSPDVKHTPTDKHSERAATSLILFEEVDLIFDDDVGFLTAVQTFMKTTRRPVILTTSDSSFSSKFEGKFETILFKTPSVVNVSSYLQLLCLAENVRTVPEDVTSLVRLNQVDIRRSIMQLQLWACGGGSTAPGCTRSMLGLNIGPTEDLETTLKCHPWTEPSILKLMDILTESWRTGVALLYSNLELLLPLPARTESSPVHNPQEVPLPGLQGEPTSPDLHLPIPLIPNQTSPVKVSSSSRLRRRKWVPNSSDHSVAMKPHRDSLSLRTLSNAEITNHHNKKLAKGLVSNCLGAISDFLDVMSFIDASLASEAAHKVGACRPLVWTGAEVKDGLLDEMRKEDGRMWGCETTVEIQAAVEVLGFHKCLARVSEGWTRAQGLTVEQRSRVVEKLTLPVATHRKGFSTSQTTPCEPSVVHSRRAQISNILSSKAFGTLGNKQAVVVHYLPILRTICHSEREQGRGNGRFLHYASSHLSLPNTSWRFLAEDFP